MAAHRRREIPAMDQDRGECLACASYAEIEIGSVC
jgi:hypothetical protein